MLATLDWEMATLGDPLADLGYLLATWTEPGTTPEHPLELSPATSLAGFPTRDELAARYAERSGVSVRDLGWYQALALWKGSIFLEGNYRRHLDGLTDDDWHATLGDAVPVLVERAWRHARAHENAPAAT